MAITIDYSTYTINIPKADLTLIQATPVEQRQLNIDAFRQILNDLMDDAEGIPFPTNHRHIAPFTISGVTLARVVEILDPYTITFEDDQYQVNIVGGNSNIADKVNPNQVGVNTANSAGLQDPVALQAGAFGGSISIDPNAVQSGTTFPFGTRQLPVNNISDAISIAEFRGIRDILILEDMTLDSGDFSDGYNFQGDNENVVVTLNAATNVTNCEFRNMTITGDLDGNNTLRQCAIQSINFFNGFIFQSGISGTITLGGTSTAVIAQCFSLVAGTGPGDYPKINCSGTMVTPLVIRDWSGGIGVENCTDQQADASIDILSGRCVFEATITDGDWTVRGSADVEDSSGAGATVYDRTTNCKITRTMKHAVNRLETNPSDGVATLYDDDGVTPLETSQMYEDVAAAQTYRGQGAERRNGFS